MNEYAVLPSSSTRLFVLFEQSNTLFASLNDARPMFLPVARLYPLTLLLPIQLTRTLALSGLICYISSKPLPSCVSFNFANARPMFLPVARLYPLALLLPIQLTRTLGLSGLICYISSKPPPSCVSFNFANARPMFLPVARLYPLALLLPIQLTRTLGLSGLICYISSKPPPSCVSFNFANYHRGVVSFHQSCCLLLLSVAKIQAIVHYLSTKATAFYFY